MGNLGLATVIFGAADIGTYFFFRQDYVNAGGWGFAELVALVGFVALMAGVVMAAIESWHEGDRIDALINAVRGLGPALERAGAGPDLRGTARSRVCESCGRQSPEGAAFCTSCGRPMRAP